MEILKQSSDTREDLGLLAVMEAIEGCERITQRELATATGLNLKKVNYCLHKLLEKGHVKFQRVRQNPDKRAYLYILTPAGVKAKSELTYRFLKFTFDFYGRVEEKLKRCLRDMAAEGLRKVLLFGLSDAARIVISITEGVAGIQPIGLIDGQAEQRNFKGLPVFRVDEIDALEWDGILITDLDDAQGAEACLLAAGVSEASIWRL